jgi:hypothetical protein
VKSSSETLTSKERYGLAKAFSGARKQRLLKADVKDSLINQLVGIGSITKTKEYARCIVMCGGPRWRPKRFSSSLEHEDSHSRAFKRV